jgi:phosphohistidine swiveling domain-containing protein
MKAENLLKLTKSEKINNFVPKFWVIETVTELHIEDFANDKLYAVRSSCDVEDSSTSSYAGCFTTLLNVKKEALKEASRKVFESFGEHSGKVIIQEMVSSEISGILFTANPIGILNEMVIVAGLGLGDGVVEDKVSTTTYYYNTDDKIYYYDGEKLLKNDEVKGLINLAELIKDYVGYEADIEFAIEGGQIYILQVRPITTLKDIKEMIVLDNSNIVESYPGISYPLTQDFVKEIYYKVFKSLVLRLTSDSVLIEKMDSHLKNMTDIANARVYYRISNWYNVLNLLPFSKKIIGIWQEMLGVTNKAVVSDFKVGFKTKAHVLMSFINLIITSPKKMEKLNEYFTQKQYEYRAMIDKADTTSELLNVYQTIMDDLTSVWDITLVNDMYSFIFTALSGKKGKERLANIKNLESMKPVIALNELVKLYKQDGLGETYLLKEKEYIETFGDRCLEELKLETKTYRTNPELLRQYIEGAEVLMLSTDVEKGRDKYFVKKAKVGIYNREISRMNRTRIFGMAREIMLRIGDNFVLEGCLKTREDVFFLFYGELSEKKDYKALVEERRQLCKNYESLPAFSRLVYKDEIVHKNYVHSGQEILETPDKLYGIASSVGVVTGEVLVINAPDINIDTSNKIIVTKTTDPGWVFLIKNCLGIIAEKGSMLSHTAIITRELKKPSVVNVKDITKVVKTGDTVELNAVEGTITILKRV